LALIGIGGNSKNNSVLGNRNPNANRIPKTAPEAPINGTFP
jgi:hypothetical protein